MTQEHVEIKTVYPLSEESKDWLRRMMDYADDDRVENVFWGDVSNRFQSSVDRDEIVFSHHHAIMPNGAQAWIVASINVHVGDWAAYLGAGTIWQAKAHGNKLPEVVARASLDNVPADFHYRP